MIEEEKYVNQLLEIIEKSKIPPKDKIQQKCGDFVVKPLTYKDTNIKGFMVLSKEPYNPQLKSLGETYQNKHRYYYYEKFDNDANKKEALFIMFNPSNANPEKDDQTIRNCRKLLKNKNQDTYKYKSMEIINLFSERNPKVNKIDFDGETNKLNSEFITTLLENKPKNNVDIILAWGYGKEKITKYQTQINTTKKQLQGNNNLKHLKHKKSKDENLICHPSNSFWNHVGGFQYAELAELEILKDNDEYIYQ
jgi:hypothetical protein